jgi:hypothetical protein
VSRDDGGVTGGPPDPWDGGEEPADLAEGDVLEGGFRPPWCRRAWAVLPRSGRVLLVGVLVLAAAAAGGLELRDRAAERELGRQVDLSASLGLSSLSTTPPGGQVSFFVVVRNEGPRPVRITAVEGTAAGLRLRGVDVGERLLSPDAETAVPVSVRLTCPGYDGGGDLVTSVAVRRQDGGRATPRVRPEPAGLLTDVADTLCRSRPDLRDQELSGPVLDDLAGDGPTS